MGKRSYVFFTIGVILLLVFIVWFFTPQVPSSEKNSSIQVLLGSYVMASAHEIFNGELIPLSFTNDGSVLSRAYFANAGTTVSIVRWPDQIGNVVFIESSDENKVIDSASSIKDTVSFSPDGTLITYAELNVPFGSTLYSENILDWNVVLQNIETEEKTILGAGYRPFIVSENPLILIYSTPEGVVAYHGTSQERVVLLPERNIEHILQAGIASPGGEYLGFFNSTTNRFSIYRTEGEFPFTITPIGEVPVPVETAALSKDAFYGVIRDQETNQRQLWRFAYKDFIDPSFPRSLIHTFVEDTPVYSIIP